MYDGSTFSIIGMRRYMTMNQLPSCADADDWVTVTRVVSITDYRQFSLQVPRQNF